MQCCLLAFYFNYLVYKNRMLFSIPLSFSGWLFIMRCIVLDKGTYFLRSVYWRTLTVYAGCLVCLDTCWTLRIWYTILAVLFSSIYSWCLVLRVVQKSLRSLRIWRHIAWYLDIEILEEPAACISFIFLQKLVAFYQNIRRHIPEDYNFVIHRRESFKLHAMIIILYWSHIL